MAYTVLARRYRSQSFDDVVGQDAVSQTLKNAIDADRVSHAYLFCGTRGVGKTTMARILAKALNCLSFDKPTTEPCCKCDSCLAINTGEDIDVIEIDGASNNKVEHIHDLRQNAIYRPARSRYKIYIIDEVHMLSNSAFNALLKTLEEPPDHVKFIFATTEPNKVLATIQSRCQRFDFKSIEPQEIAAQLARVLDSESIGYDSDVVTAVARLANGSMRDGLSVLDQLISSGADPLDMKVFEDVLGEPDRDRIASLLEMVGSDDTSGVLGMLDGLLRDGMTPLQIVEAAIEVLRDMMVVKAGGSEKLLILTTAEKNRINSIVEQFDIASIIYAIASLEKIRYPVKESQSARALLEALFLRLTLSEHFIGVNELIKRIDTGRLNVKKKLTDSFKPSSAGLSSLKNESVSSESSPDKASCGRQPEMQTFTCRDLDEVVNNWQNITNSLGAIQQRLGLSLAKSQPSEFDGQTLKVQFSASDKMPMQICTHASDEVCTYLSKLLGSKTTVKFEISQSVGTKKQARRSKGAGFSRQQKEQALQDSGVKMLTEAFKARVVGIHLKEQ
ncbi:DNA polymerase III subunit gamma/tau [Limihaloglobus sulfuriphilus]|uniref:DNA polymerase III subunit gamma/tau n=1 Tax=Limihaloglobus sulfuriphilus TaxID=1851148 RepID=A0A1Q2MCI6_9BACT|nr:DNA polymerase III subunit gamma/tau [Limihaloglobus sulfuriphilus]AQQ70405.1 DNA polymerase III subunit gamma/tau [Limihaloglobus sulfuriphilus]